MTKTIRRILPGLSLLATCLIGVALAAMLSGRTVQRVKPLPAQRNNLPPAVGVSAPVQEENKGASVQDSQVGEDEDKLCGLCRYLSGIEIARNDEDYEIGPRAFKKLSRQTLTIELELGESIENQFILLRGASPRAEFRIEQQFETSLTVSDEGPHLDLIDWKHYRSEWREIKKLAADKFLTLKLSEDDSSKFPAVTMREVRREVARVSGGKWSRLVRRAKTVNEYPLGVGVSKISLRIKVREDGQWKVIKRLDFIMPMGC